MWNRTDIHRKRPAVHSNVHQPLALEVIWAITQFHRGNLLNGALRWIKMSLCDSFGNNISFFIKVFSLQPLSPTWILHFVHDVLEMKLMLKDCHVILQKSSFISKLLICSVTRMNFWTWMNLWMNISIIFFTHAHY